MKLSLSLSIMLGLATLFQGCSDGGTSATAVKSNNKNVTISGSTTLSSGFKSETKATVCLDENSNQKCDEHETTVQTDEQGQYTLELNHEVKDGALLIADGGLSRLPREVNSSNLNTLTLYKYYASDEGSQNINPMSTIIVNDLLANTSSNYDDTISDIANKYNFNEDRLLDDPIDVSTTWYSWFTDGPEFFEKVAALEIYLMKVQKANKSPIHKAAAQDTSPTDDELNTIITENQTLFDEYLKAFQEYLETLSQSISDWYDDWTKEEAAKPPVAEKPPVVNPPAVTQEPITRSKINGVWYIIDKSGDKTCAYIDSSNNISVTEADGKTTNLSLTYKQIDANRASILLKLGFFTADTIVFDKYMSDSTFDGHYTSDGETLKGSSMSSIANCKKDKLGL